MPNLPPRREHASAARRPHGAPAFLLALLVAGPATTTDAMAGAGTNAVPAQDRLHPLLAGEIDDARETLAQLVSMLRQGSGKPWLLGLGIPCREQARIEAFLRSEGDARDRAVLSAGASWTRDSSDGHGGSAVLPLIDVVRVLRRGGRDIRVVCFDDGAGNGDSADCDTRMAAALRTALAKERNQCAVIPTDDGCARASTAHR